MDLTFCLNDVDVDCHVICIENSGTLVSFSPTDISHFRIFWTFPSPPTHKNHFAFYISHCEFLKIDFAFVERSEFLESLCDAMRKMEADCGSTSYYSILGVSSGCSIDEIRRAYRKLAMKWHPDRCAKNPSLLSTAKRKFQQIQEAYSVLSDQRKRTRYDAGIQDFDDGEDDEGMCDFVQELWSLIAEGKKGEDKSYSLEELQRMLMEMARSFDFGSWSSYRTSGCEMTQWP